MIDLEKPNEPKQNSTTDTQSQDKIERIDYRTQEIPDGYSVLDSLPSRFIPYNTNGLYVRPLNIGELERLGDLKPFDLNKFLSIIKDVIKGVNIRDLTVLDLKVALIYSLILSEDVNGWTLNNTCQYCGTKFPHSLKIQELEFEDFPMNELPIRSSLPELQGWDFNLLRMRHLLEVNALLESKSADEEFNAKLLMLAFASYKEDKLKAYNELYNLPAKENLRDEINRLYSLIVQSIKPIRVSCPNPALYLTFTDLKDASTLQKEFKSVQMYNNSAYLPTDASVRNSILDFLAKNNIKFERHRCGHTQLREVGLDFSHLYP